MPLPPGTILNPATGQITGVPSQAGTFAFELRVRDALGTSRVLSEDIEIEAYTPMSAPAALAAMMATRVFAGSAAVTGGKPAIAYSVLSGSLPAGLSLNAGTGAITGTPSTPGAYAVTIRATDSIGQVKDTTYTGTVATNLTLTYSLANATVGVAYSGSPTVAGGTAPRTFAIATGALPAGVSRNASTGVLSGTPTTPGTSNFTMLVTDANGFQAVTSALSIVVAAFPALSGALPRTMVGRAYSASYTRTGGHPSFTYGATGLPSGLTINSSTGAITGTVGGSPGLFNTTVTLTDSLGNVTQRSQQIEVAAALSLGGSVPAATRAVPYSFNPTRGGGYTPYTFAISAGALPAGITLDANSGVISGTPTLQGNNSATLRMTDADGQQITMAVNINVAGDLSLSNNATTVFSTGTVSYGGSTFTVTGGQAPYSFSIASGALPPGLTFSTSTGAISGTANNGTEGNYSYTMRVTDAIGQTADVTNVIAHANYPTLTGSIGDMTNGVAVNRSLSRAGGHLPGVYSISAGALPSGLTINSSTGAITGTPTVNGAASFTVRFTDARGNIVNNAQSLTVFADLSFSGTYANETEADRSGFTDGLAYSSSITANGGKSPISWALSGTLPPGLSFNNGTGQITGRATFVQSVFNAGFADYGFTVTATDALGQTAQQNVSLRVYAHVYAPYAPPPLGDGFSYGNGVQGIAVNLSKPFAKGKAPLTYSIVSGSIPPGLSFNSSTSAITGTPTTPGSYSFTLRATDALGAIADISSSLGIFPVTSINVGTPPRATIGIAYSHTVTAANGGGGYSFSIVSGSLPPGLTINSANGAITGTPSSGPGTYNFTVRATSAFGSSSDAATSIVLAAYPNFSVNYPRGMVGKAYSGSVSASGGHAPITYALIGGSLPSGVSLNASTGALSGTPSGTGTFTGTIRQTDAAGNLTDRGFSIAINPALALPGGALSGGTTTVGYNADLSPSGGWTPYGFAVVSGALPTGLTLNASTGNISGTPSVAGNYNFTIRLTDADGSTVDAAFSINVVNPVVTLDIGASPNPASAYGTSFGSPVTVSRAVTATATGGTGSYSYSWSFISASGSASPVFSVSGLSTNVLTASVTRGINYSRTEVWRCTVNDGVNTDFVDVTITLVVEREGGG